ncbi:aldehyde ferredoxin oxidoreductase C-terminal domain-containing protein [Desulfovibrio sp. DV]|uniref:aldehyde ferredoxin oxidoreductase C-terminal domain-containing protein n=1 Tax=Desulfovibrio sp. DV TaxID=1844708 RepID=UPI0020C9EF4B|nr:aldehyde ferredoxin oxidoreductase C-terminal domain-containing protein [Desulfovibrio sp. DV]
MPWQRPPPLAAVRFLPWRSAWRSGGLAVSAATGTAVAAGELARRGERAVFRERQLNARAGLGAAADDLPERFFTEPGSSGEGIDVPPLSRPAFLAARAGYYRLRGATEDGRPSPERADNLELAWLE